MMNRIFHHSSSSSSSDNARKIVQWEDCASMDRLDKAHLLQNLADRYARDEIYTNIGNVLLAVNPHREIPGLYGEEAMKLHASLTRLPHPFQVAEICLRGVRRGERHSVLVSGESGAGKTETAKIMMRYLEANAARVAGSNGDGLRRPLGSCRGFESELSASACILEAFGHAATARNLNSSRFGKHLQLQVESGGFRVRIQTYLLETSRLLHIGSPQQERMFHVFYQLASTCNKTAQVLESGLEDDTIAAESGRSTAREADFKLLDTALDRMQVLVCERERLWRVLASILHLRSFLRELTSLSASKKEETVNANTKSIKSAAACLKICPERLQHTLEVASIKVKARAEEEAFEKPRSVSQVLSLVRSLVVTLYTSMFKWLVDGINSKLGAKRMVEGQGEIRILDVYGFENLEHNSLEQLLINLTNEKLQQLFVDRALTDELEIHKREGLRLANIEPFARSSPIEEMEAVLVALDKQGEMRNLKYGQQHGLSGVDETAVYKDIQGLVAQRKADRGSRSCLKLCSRSSSDKSRHFSFCISHYAGDVQYTLDNWLDSNDARPQPEVLSLMGASKVAFIQPTTSPVGGMRLQSRSRQYRNDLSALLKSESACKLHFVRCFRPNATMQPRAIDRQYLEAQILQSGTIELLKVMKHGFPHRISIVEVAQRFHKLVPSAQSPRMMVQAVLHAYGVARCEWSIGASQLFLKAGQISVLEKLLEARAPPDARKLKLAYKVLLRTRLRAVVRAVIFCRRVQVWIWEAQRKAAAIKEAMLKEQKLKEERLKEEKRREATAIKEAMLKEQRLKEERLKEEKCREAILKEQKIQEERIKEAIFEQERLSEERLKEEGLKKAIARPFENTKKRPWPGTATEWRSDTRRKKMRL